MWSGARVWEDDPGEQNHKWAALISGSVGSLWGPSTVLHLPEKEEKGQVSFLLFFNSVPTLAPACPPLSHTSQINLWAWKGQERLVAALGTTGGETLRQGPAASALSLILHVLTSSLQGYLHTPYSIQSRSPLAGILLQQWFLGQ